MDVTIPQRIDELLAQHQCSMRHLAKNVLYVDPGYLSKLRLGVMNNPSASLQRRLGIKAIVRFERVGDAAGNH